MPGRGGRSESPVAGTRAAAQTDHSREAQGLLRAGLPTREINIWQDPAAAAQVRAITGGDETVPTVVVHGRAMVNPSARQVIETARAANPGAALPDLPEASWSARLLAAVTGRRQRPES